MTGRYLRSSEVEADDGEGLFVRFHNFFLLYNFGKRERRKEGDEEWRGGRGGKKERR